MEEQLRMIDEALSGAYEGLTGLKAGSEEHARLWQSIKDMELARNEIIKTYEELEGRTKQNKFTIANLVISAIGMIGIPLFGISMQRQTNIDLMSYERDDIMTHKGWDNKLLGFIFNKR